MVSRCSNPACHIEFRSISSGDLYALERRTADTEFFWLCSGCAPLLILCLDAVGNVFVKPRTEIRHMQPPHRDSQLRLVARPASEQPRCHPESSDSTAGLGIAAFAASHEAA